MKPASAKLAWLEGIRALAALAILLYHAQLYFTQNGLSLYWLMLPIMVIGALIFSIVADYTTPLIQRITTAVLQDLDDLLATSSTRQRWHPEVGNRVRYLGESGWIILNVERLLDSQPLCFCRAADGYRSTWLRAEELEPENDSPANQTGQSQNRRSQSESFL
jgi:hypothetical protein